jgi:hypothetical protein
MVLAIGHALRSHEALSRPYALPGFLEIVHSLVKDGVFVGHDQSIREGSVRSLDCFASHASTAMGAAPGYRLKMPRPAISATPRSTRAPKAR